MFNRPQFPTLVKMLQEPRRFLQILSGPRQVGKTTLARQALDTAFVSAQSGIKWQDAMQDHAWWGRLVESAVGAHLHNSRSSGMEVQYWRERNHEVDFVLTQGARMAVIEVKTGAAKGALSGLKKFTEQFREAKPFVVGTGGIPLEQFLMTPADHWLS